MKKTILSLVALGVFAFLAYSSTQLNPNTGETAPPDPVAQIEKLQTGDIIFQTSNSSQSRAIQLATHSKYSHVGIIYEEDGVFWVFEAVQPVKTTALSTWIKQGDQGHYVVKRLRNASEVLTPANLARMKAIGKHFEGTSYDIYFGWTDSKMYCSELVWKMYQRATGIELGSLQRLSDFDLNHDLVKTKLKERYGDRIPMDEQVISPAAIFNSDKLITVTEQ